MDAKTRHLPLRDGERSKSRCGAALSDSMQLTDQIPEVECVDCMRIAYEEKVPPLQRVAAAARALRDEPWDLPLPASCGELFAAVDALGQNEGAPR